MGSSHWDWKDSEPPWTAPAAPDKGYRLKRSLGATISTGATIFWTAFNRGGCRLGLEEGACCHFDSFCGTGFVVSCSGTVDWTNWPTSPRFTCLHYLTTGITNLYHHTWLCVGLGIIYALVFISTLLADLLPQPPFLLINLSLVLVFCLLFFGSRIDMNNTLIGCQCTMLISSTNVIEHWCNSIFMLDTKR